MQQLDVYGNLPNDSYISGINVSALARAHPEAYKGDALRAITEGFGETVRAACAHFGTSHLCIYGLRNYVLSQAPIGTRNPTLAAIDHRIRLVQKRKDDNNAAIASLEEALRQERVGDAAIAAGRERLWTHISRL